MRGNHTMMFLSLSTSLPLSLKKKKKKFKKKFLAALTSASWDLKIKGKQHQQCGDRPVTSAHSTVSQ